MSFLKWLLKAGFILALMFLGLNTQPKHSDNDTEKKSATFMSLMN